ncbi:WbqC family protein [Achromobacter dolens]|uniref:WbqC family protein n=1 Tax=Achromobacter dolens TaxID=1287738 RepID=UPI00300C36AB
MGGRGGDGDLEGKLMGSTEVRCAIHQPNFFPWLGYFNKVARADVFVLLDDAQYQKTGGTWTNRVQIRAGAQALWLTVPIDRSYSGTRRTNEIQFSAREAAWQEKALKTIQQNYSKARFYGEVAPALIPLLMHRAKTLCDYNINIILGICDLLGISKSKIKIASELAVAETATDRLIAICKKVGANTYVCGGGASGYQEDEKFEESGLRLEYQNFQHPVYMQYGGGAFISGLSILDPLMNCGVCGVRDMLEINN